MDKIADMITCFFLEPTLQVRLSLRRYRSSDETILESNCAINGYHDASTPLAIVVETCERQPGKRAIYDYIGPKTREDVNQQYPDRSWPECCACGYQFREEDQWQVFNETLLKRQDTGEVMTFREAAPGAMMNAEWLTDIPFFTGPDGLSLIVKCPNGRSWQIDGPCSNCTKPEDKVHKCWCRHGVPPKITVDKNCNTCSAGAGSIQAGDYHGFLREGVFIDA